MADTAGRARFPTTRWSRVLAAGAEDGEGRAALALLCEAYWQPLYGFARRRGNDPDKALDLTQGFFARLLEKRDLTAADPTRGRFRSWLLAGLKHYMANDWARESAIKRGGGLRLESLDAAEGERRYACEPMTEIDPERLYDRRWALRVTERAFCRLQELQKTPESRRLLERIAPYLLAEIDGEAAALAAELQMPTDSLAVRLHRLRRRYGDLVRQEVAETLDDPNDVDAEIRYLVEVLGAAWRAGQPQFRGRTGSGASTP